MAHKIQPNFGLHLLALLSLFGFEGGIFYHVVADQIAPFYPPYYDQASYYFGVYELVERIRAHGWIELLLEFAPPKHAFGASFLAQGAVLALIGGNTRTSILSLNLVYFIALQIALFEAVRRKTDDIAMAWVAIALLVPLATIFSIYGGIYDFRVDFTALCFYGIWTCVLLWSESFRYRNRSVVVAAVSVMLVSLRFITAVYVALIFVCLFLTFVIGMWRGAAPFRRGMAARRLRNIIITGVLTAIVVGPLLFAAKDIIYFYYVIGHIITGEKYIRARELGLHTISDHISYYPRSVFLQHVGAAGLVLWSIAGVAIAAGASWFDRLSLSNGIARLQRFQLEFLTLALVIIVPLAILTIDIAKSPVVGGIVVIPLLMVVVLFCAALWPHRLKPPVIADVSAEQPSKFTRFAITRRWVSAKSLKAIVCAGLLVAALVSFTRHGTVRQQYMERGDLEHVAIINKAIARYVVENTIVDPKLSVDRVVDYLNLPTVRLATYESFGKIIYYDGRFGQGANGLVATPRELALQLIADSDVIVLTDPIRGREAPYPINTKIREYWDELRNWTVQNRRLLVSVDILGIPHRAYVKAPSKDGRLEKLTTGMAWSEFRLFGDARGRNPSRRPDPVADRASPIMRASNATKISPGPSITIASRR